jgi:RimJ/RimL family protein N-acetyltransferase
VTARQGPRHDDQPGWGAVASVLADIDPSGALAQEEIFGPVLATFVAATGTAVLEPHGSTVRLLRLSALERLPSARMSPLAAWQREQQVAPVRDIAELRGSTEEGDDFGSSWRRSTPRVAGTRQSSPMSVYKPMPLHLETERLRLRPWAEPDAEDLCALLSERGSETRTVEQVRAGIAERLAATAATGLALLPIRRRDEGDFIGYCGLIIGRSTVEEPEIAYELLRRAHGRGYATEAAGAVLDAAIATGRKRLWASVGTWNTASFRVLEKLGFERDHVSADDRGEFVWLTRSMP